MIPKPQTMSQESRREAFDLALRTLPREFEPADVYAWLHRNAPWIDDVWIQGRLVADTVNDRRRQHVPGPRDVLYGRIDGRFERYDPNAHGWWSNAGRPAEGPAATANVARLIVGPATAAPATDRAGAHLRHRKAG